MKIKSWRIGMVGVLFLSGQLHAEDPYRPSLIKEATRAVVDRVFGQEGDGAHVEYHVVELTHVSPGSSATRSLLIPGWGQRFNQQRVKGSLIFLLFAGTTFGSFHLASKAKHTFDDYKDKGLAQDSLYDDYKDQKAQSEILAGTAGLIWIFSIFDAYRHAYNPLYGASTNMDLAYAHDRLDVRWSKKFQ